MDGWMRIIYNKQWGPWKWWSFPVETTKTGRRQEVTVEYRRLLRETRLWQVCKCSKHISTTSTSSDEESAQQLKTVKIYCQKWSMSTKAHLLLRIPYMHHYFTCSHTASELHSSSSCVYVTLVHQLQANRLPHNPHWWHLKHSLQLFISSVEVNDLVCADPVWASHRGCLTR